MDLSVDLIKEFAKITNDEPVINEGSTVYGKYILQGDEAFVEIDGSDGTLTPVATTSTAKNNDRVTVLIKDHTAIVTGNLTDPSASSEEVEDVKKQMGTAALDIEGLKKQLENQEITMQEYDEAIAEAKRKATDYINFEAGTGLVIGSASHSGSVLLYSGGMEIRNNSVVLARYTEDKIALGINSQNSVVELCGGLGTIQSEDGELAIQSNFVRIHPPGADPKNDPWFSVSTETIGLRGSDSNKLILNRSGGILYGSWIINGYAKENHTHTGYASSSHTHTQSSLNLTDTLDTHAVAPVTDAKYACGLSNYRWSNVYCKNSTINTSDKNEKTEIKPIDDKYIQLFDLLEPVQYMWRDGDRIHTGFISQELEAAMNKVGLTDMEFAGFCKDLIETEDGDQYYRYGIRYGEFIGILSTKIKQLEARISELENKEVSQ